MESSNTHLMDILERWNRENERGVVLEDLMIKNLAELIKTQEWLDQGK